MPATFGGATSDDAAVNGTVGMAATSVNLMCGWYYPTTLTASKGFWGGSNNETRCTVSPANTARVRVIQNRATTDSVHDTSVDVLAVDRWHFIAIATKAASSGGPAVPLVWVALEGDATPTGYAVSQITAGSGNHSASTAPVCGNLGTTATASFEGDICDFSQLYSSDAQATNYLGVSPDATFTSADVFVLMSNFILPIYRGHIGKLLSPIGRPYAGNGANLVGGFVCFTTLAHNAGGVDMRNWVHRNGAAIVPAPLGTLNGPVVSTTNSRGPREPLNMLHQGMSINSGGARRRAVWLNTA